MHRGTPRRPVAASWPVVAVSLAALAVAACALEAPMEPETVPRSAAAVDTGTGAGTGHRIAQEELRGVMLVLEDVLERETRGLENAVEAGRIRASLRGLIGAFAAGSRPAAESAAKSALERLEAYRISGDDAAADLPSLGGIELAIERVLDSLRDLPADVDEAHRPGPRPVRASVAP